MPGNEHAITFSQMCAARHIPYFHYCYIALIFLASGGIKQSMSMAELIIFTIVVVKIQVYDNTRTKRQLYQKKFRQNTGNNSHERMCTVPASAVVASLLLRSGDVEQNPGPGQQSCKLILL